MREMTKRILLCALMMTLLIAGCTVAQATETPAAPAVNIELTRFATSTLTPTMTNTPVDAPTATLAPTQTPTPRAYAVKEKDTMSLIAFRNGLTLDELKAA